MSSTEFATKADVAELKAMMQQVLARLPPTEKLPQHKTAGSDRKLRLLARRKRRQARAKANQAAVFASPVPPPAAFSPPVSVPAAEIDAAEIDMEDASDKAESFLPGQATSYPIANQAPASNPNLAPASNNAPSQTPVPGTDGQNQSAPTSEMLTPTDLATLRQPSTQTPTSLNMSTNLRSDTIVDFYDTLVEANTKIPRVNKGLEVQLLTDFVLAGTAPFWNDFVPLSAEQIMNMAKRCEDMVVQETLKTVAGKTMNQAQQDMQYQKLASKVGIASNTKGIEAYATEAAKVLETEQSPT